MLIWVTRPDLATVVIRGVPDCSVWLVKPEYNASERGVEIDPLYPEKPIGWQTADGYCPSTKIAKAFKDHPELVREVIRGLHSSVGESVKKGKEFDVWWKSLDRWNKLWRTVSPNTYDDPNNGRNTMCLEIDVPWEVWFELANKATENSDVRYSRWLASLNPDLPF